MCLGAQIIAHAFGGEIYRMGKLESGFYQLGLTARGSSRPAVSRHCRTGDDLRKPLRSHTGHAGAVTLVTGGACPVQAFRIGAKTYGVQFHVEVTIDIIRDWIGCSARISVAMSQDC